MGTYVDFLAFVKGFPWRRPFCFLLYHGFLKTRVERCRLLKNLISKSIMLTVNIIDSVLSIPLRVYCLAE